jgi:hypothetical protein
MNPLSLKAITRTAGKILLVGLVATVTESTAHARPWEPIETSFE